MGLKFRFILVASVALSVPAVAKDANYPKAEAQTLDLAQKAIAIRSVRGEGNRTADVAKLFGDALIAGGWSASDIEIMPVDDTAYLIATWKGSNAALKPLVISGHMDVVEAKREDWERDPFVPVVENGILFGRGASDMKFDGALALSTLIELRRQGYKPRRTIVIEFSGDEETTMKTSAIIAEKLKNAELVINVDGGGGALDEATGKPLYWTWQGAEKTYADYRLEVTNAGGHSSAPRPDNAIVQLSHALAKVGAYKFTAEQNDITKGYFEKAAAFTEKAEIAAAMRAFAANPADEKALATLRADPSMVGKVGTTCVPTMLGGGHAENALPQRAWANINCRIFPGHSKEAIMAELGQVVGDPAVKITDVTLGSVASPASPLRADLMSAVTKAMAKSYPGVALIPSQASGASDSMWFRAVGVPSYGLSPAFSKDSEDFSHGLNERTRLSNIRPGITYYLSLITDLSK
ncbi:M20/M25/M40 family metallo-hydrolase [Novosphingobium sp. MMS21-SN21R]|uniref:M20/M25/M40 family metallo-hydrolase n=1 Tax=Novosphingobium sp. MMS21-SN21R TaxID=2969298 RepID=UPI002887BA8B|nr:M20/M25/M40 family metallo-hydrolase [Novosphingobium sp. MMS21-SN21R]MDT0508346.1 M20/M25/M40 family metallo-hydrolase [Novosphingobium sp. MMS21-SN21R]